MGQSPQELAVPLLGGCGQLGDYDRELGEKALGWQAPAGGGGGSAAANRHGRHKNQEWTEWRTRGRLSRVGFPLFISYAANRAEERNWTHLRHRFAARLPYNTRQ